jgi:nicotinic acid mononucleotide adenylyltransferase
VAADGYDETLLDISARKILKDIPKGRGEWETLLPKQVAELIRERKLFGYPG